MKSLKTVFENTFASIEAIQKSFHPHISFREVGKITTVSQGIVRAEGLPGVGFEELVQLPHGIQGFTFALDPEDIGIVLLGDHSQLKVGDEVKRTGKTLEVLVGHGLIGRVIDPLGNPLDGKGVILHESKLPIERQAPHIMDRAPVTAPLQTGIKVVDSMIPIGKGQRELILGDRKTGKTALAIDTILNQQDQNVICIYCAICQRASSVAKCIRLLQEGGAMKHTIVVVTEGNDSPGLNFVAPYAATSIGEYFMEKGKDVLIVYDDLIQHARSYRELSLLLKRPPGRAAFPGDIFYVHSRLLERSTHLKDELGGGSLTALPIIETQAQNISAYIVTNLISITDGQVYLSPTLFELGILPAVDVTKSVSRVGGKAQISAYRSIASSLRLEFSQFEELEEFIRLGSYLDEHSKKIIDRGRRIRECLKQPDVHPLSVFKQILLFVALSNGLLDSIPLEKIHKAEKLIYAIANTLPKEALFLDSTKKVLIETMKKELNAL